MRAGRSRARPDRPSLCAVDADTCRDLVQRYYGELWNEWRLELIDELLAPDLHFRGSLGTVLDGRDDFRGYLLGIRQALPDFHHDLEWVVAEEGEDGNGGAAAARIVYSGTHEGDLFGVPGTGHRINYQGAAFFRMAGFRLASAHEGSQGAGSGSPAVITEIWTLGDMSAVRRQLLGTATS